MPIISFDPASLANYYFARLPSARAPARTGLPAALPPWDIRNKPPAKEAADVAARGTDPYFDPKDRSLFATAKGTATNSGSQIEALVTKSLSKPGADGALAADNHKLFALYQALHRLDHIAQMANRDGSVDGQRPGLNGHFQNGLKQILSYVETASFNKISLMPGSKSASTESSVVIPYAPYNYTGKGVAQHSGWSAAVPGVTAADKFTVSVTKGGVTTGVEIDLADVSGVLSLDNINTLVNQKLQDAGFSTRFTRVQTGGSIVEDTATWGMRISNGAGETVTLSSDQAEAALYIAGTSGGLAGQHGRLTKLGNLDAAPESIFSADIAPEAGAASARATAVDAEGNVYVVGNSSGSFGSQRNQASQDVFLTKYDSAGQVRWTRLLGSADTAAAYALKVDPTGGVVVAGSVTGDLTPTAIGGASDSFVAKYDAHGNQSWLRQTAPLAADQAQSLSVDASGNVYVGGQLSGTIGAGQTSAGGTDAYITKLTNKGALVYHRQFGTAGTDSAAQTAIASDGNLVVASVEDGHAIVRKYGAADGTSAAMWQMDLGEIQNGAISGLVVSGDQVYLSGTTANAALTAGGQATIAQASSGNSEAFIFNLTDSGASAAADFVAYVGTSGSEQGGGLALSGGKVYLTGTTDNTFAGQTRSVAGTHNMFVTRLSDAGVSEWTRQYGGREGQSKGLALAADSSGASVLDALGLPRGKIDITQSSVIEAQTTARAGDHFMLRITGRSGSRDVTITLAKGETLRSLATKMNVHLGLDAKATAMPTTGGQKLKIAVNEGVQIELIAGEKDFNALAGLGLSEQVLIKESAADKQAAKSSTIHIGLALNGKLDLLSKTEANHAHSVLLAAMAQIKQAYAKLNDPPAGPSFGPGPAHLQAQLGSYQNALLGLSLGTSRNA